MLRWIVAACGLLSLAAADPLTLKDGKTVNGICLGGDSRSVRMAVGPFRI
jgi:hypothetical protein